MCGPRGSSVPRAWRSSDMPLLELRDVSKAFGGLQITDRGIARTFQTLRLFLNMTVLENVMAAEYGHTKATVLEAMLQLPRSRREEKRIRQLAEEKLAFFGQRLAGYRHDQ